MDKQIPEKEKATVPSHPAGQLYTESEKTQLKRHIKENVSVTVEKMSTLKCPRCYMYDGIECNFMKICDRCCWQLLDGADMLVEMGRLTLYEKDSMVEGIKSAQLLQIEKYKNK